MVWRASSSAEATRKLLELEAMSKDITYDVRFPTLEQVFLKVTSDSNTAVHDNGGDGIAGEEEISTVIDEKLVAIENENRQDINLDVGHSIGLARQIITLFRKRYILLLHKAGWISYAINLAIPIIIACALVKFMYRGFQPHYRSCHTNDLILRNQSFADTFDVFGLSSVNWSVLAPLDSYQPLTTFIGGSGSTPSAFIGPKDAFKGAVQDELYLFKIPSTLFKVSDDVTFSPIANVTLQDDLAFSSRVFVNSTSDMIFHITNSSGEGYFGFGIWSPTPEAPILYYNVENDIYADSNLVMALNLITNRIANATTKTGTARLVDTQIRTMRHADSIEPRLALPISILLCLAFVAAASIAVIYPAFEKNNRVRSLHYCNGVSPFSLWSGYLLFDMQFIIIQSIFVWGLLFIGPLAKQWYESNYILGVFILFGIATYLGTYFISLFLKKAAFAIAAGVHVLLFVFYLIAYVINQSVGPDENLYQNYSFIQYGIGLSSPAANLARALFVATNSYGVLCGKYGTEDVSQPFAYVRYGSVYANLLIQIVFLIIMLFIYEYRSADWVRRNITHRGIPARLHYTIDSGPAEEVTATQTGPEKDMTATNTTSTKILEVSRISKFFGKLFAVENVSFSIAANQTLALLGGNGAGKTTVINLIRSELKPDFGSITLDDISVLKQPHKTRLQMGVCPQDDAIDNLTVRQTLDFYATVKGLRNVAGNVEKVLTALNINVFEHVEVKDLSGGTRRKLSVAIALLGNPRILLLDEPSTGQDAGAKRILWRALKNVSANRAILLTTHSMEEAEALATNVAILGTRMLATGSLAGLQEQYGGEYAVRAVRAEGVSREEAESVIRGTWGEGVKGYFDVNGQVGWGLPHDRHMLGTIMKTMEGFKGESALSEEESRVGASAGAVGGSSMAKNGGRRLFQNYTVTGPTLEEVFMNVAREAGTAGGA